MKFILAFMFFLNVLAIHAQGTWHNLVRNYSFENMTTYNDWYYSGVVGYSLDYYFFDNGQWALPYSPNDTNTLSNLEQIKKYWSYVDYWGVPDRKHFWCGVSTGGDPVGSPDLYNVNLNYVYNLLPDPMPRTYSGSNWVYTGNGDGEHLVVKFEAPLTSGNLYYMEFFCSSIASSDEGKIFLFPNYPEQCGITNGPIEDQNTGEQLIADVSYPGYNPVFYLNTDGVESTSWTRYRVYFTPNNNMEYMVIGSGTSLMWDDLKIIEVDEIMCRDDWYFDNTVFNYPFEIFQAGSTIKAGTGVDPEAGQLAGPVTVLSGSHTIFTAGSSIELLPGFSTEPGAIFETDTVPCQQLCVPLTLTDLSFDCISQPTSIGVSEYAGSYTNLSWSPSLYLDNAGSINPTFTPPAGQSGSITYTVSYMNACPMGSFPLPSQFQYQVTVNYVDPALLSIAPTINYSNLNYDDQQLSVHLDLNNAVSWFEILVYDGNGVLDYDQDYIRGIDFVGNSLDFEFGNDIQIFWSNCMDYHFVINAHNECANQAVTVEFDWLKTWDSSSEITASLPNVITPQDNDGVNDFYCFSHYGADHYELKIYYEEIGTGPLVYEETGIITDDSYFCTYFDGHASNGNLLNEDVYIAQLNLYNWCGGELLIPTTPFTMILPGKNQITDSTNFDAENENIEFAHEVIITTNQGRLNLESTNELENEIIVTNVIGEVIFNGTFSNQFGLQLSSGIYFVAIKSENGLVLTKKIVIV